MCESITSINAVCWKDHKLLSFTVILETLSLFKALTDAGILRRHWYTWIDYIIGYFSFLDRLTKIIAHKSFLFTIVIIAFNKKIDAYWFTDKFPLINWSLNMNRIFKIKTGAALLIAKLFWIFTILRYFIT